MTKKRTDQQKSEDVSRGAARRVLSEEFVVNSRENDFGLDFDVALTEDAITHQKITGTHFFLQLKSKQDTDEGPVAAVDLSTDDLEYFISKEMPVVLAIYDRSAEEFYWDIMHDYVWDNLTRPAWQDQSYCNIKIPTSQTFDDLEELKEAVVRSQRRIRSRRFQNIDEPPDGGITDLSSLGFYPVSEPRESFIEWTISDTVGTLFAFEAGITFTPIFLPVWTLPFEPESKSYTTRSRLHGDVEYLPTLIENLETSIRKHHGLEYQGWSIPVDLSREDSTYYLGSGGQNLQEALDGIEKETKRFGWIFLSNVDSGVVVYLLGGTIYDTGEYSFDLRRTINFVPNHFPFVTVEENGHTDFHPLNVNESFVMETEKWSTSFSDNYVGQNAPDANVQELPSGEIIGYLGDQPWERGVETTFRQRHGLTIVANRESFEDHNENIHPIIRDAAPWVGGIRTAPKGLDDRKEVKITEISLQGRREPLLPLESQIILFRLNIGLHQVDDLRMDKEA